MNSKLDEMVRANERCDIRTESYILKEVLTNASCDNIKRSKAICLVPILRLQEHYRTLFESPQVVMTSTSTAPRKPVQMVDTPPTLGEVCKALRGQRSGKCAGSNGIRPDVLKIGGAAVAAQIQKVCERVWLGDINFPDC